MKRILLILLLSFIASCATTETTLVRKVDNAQFIKHTDYVLQYSEQHEQAYYVAYVLESSELRGNARRKNSFRMDPLVATGSASVSDYTNSGYDKGHLAPAADMVENQTDMDESFYMSNMSPQEPSFNRGIWRRLEDQTRQWAVKHKRIVVVTGPVLRGSMKKIGKNGVSVPNYFYKVILDMDEPSIKAIGFIIPNEKSNKNLYEYAVPVDKVEAYTGLDFFPFLEDNLERKLESSYYYKAW